MTTRHRGALATAMALVLLAGCATGRSAKKNAPAPPPEQVYAQAMEKIGKKRYYTARTMLQEALPRIPPEDQELLPRVQLAIADSFYLDKGFLNYTEALNGYRNFLTYFPKHAEADRAQFMVGMSLFQQALSPDRDQSLTVKAISELARLETLHPDSPYIEQARARIKECHDRLAEHERLVGRFYQKRRAWLAAIDRYRLVLKDYPSFSGRATVLFDLGACLLRIGNRAEAEEALTRLQEEDPRGPLVGKARQLLEEFDSERRKQERAEGKKG